MTSMILFLGLLSMVSGQVMEGLVQLDKSSIDKVRSPPILGHHLKPFVQQVSKIAPLKLGTKSTQALCTGGKQSWRQQTNRDQPCHTFARVNQPEIFLSLKSKLLENTFYPFVQSNIKPQVKQNKAWGSKPSATNLVTHLQQEGINNILFWIRNFWIKKCRSWCKIHENSFKPTFQTIE